MSAISLSPSATAGKSPAGDARVGEPGYRTFISYSHADTKWATWLLRRLEGYRVPERFHGRDAPIGEVGARIAPVFRDRDELPTADDLGEAVQKALRRSATLVVICSQTAARSRWVNEEVIQFKRLGRSGRVFALIVAGEPNARDPGLECFPPALRFDVDTQGVRSEKPVELIAADAREHADGEDDAFIRLVAGMLGVGFDDLRQRERQRRRRRMMWIALGSTAGLAITISLVSLALVARNDAQRRQQNSEEYMARMLESLKIRLEKADRLDVLDEAGANAMAYFRSLNPRDLTDKTNTQQAKVLTQLGQIRVRQLRYDEAKAAFTAAFTRASALAARHPRDGEMLFERAQAEFWVGYVHRRQGNRAQASEWLVRYRDSGAALVALNPVEPRWQEELAYGHHNMAVLDLDRDKLEEARRGFLSELAILVRLSDAKPADLSLRDRIVDANSWLSTVAERSGDLREAESRCAEQVTRIEASVRAEPDNAMRRMWLADKLALHASILAITDQRSAALGCRVRARETLDALIVGDPKNMEWLRRAIDCRAREAHQVAFAGDLSRVRQLVQEVEAGMKVYSAARKENRDASGSNLTRWLDWTVLEAVGEPSVELMLTQQIEAGEAKLAKGGVNEGTLIDLARSRVVAGRMAVRAGDLPTAQKHWRRALEVLDERWERVNDWRVLDPAARAFALLGDTEHHRAIVARLDNMGYRPLEPWPGQTQH